MCDLDYVVETTPLPKKYGKTEKKPFYVTE
jgi:hypothetical protein